MFYKSLLKQRIFYYIPSSFNIFSKRELLGFSFKIVLSVKLLEGKTVNFKNSCKKINYYIKDTL